MPYFFANSIEHYTTQAQALDKLAWTGTAPVAAAGAFGQKGTRTAADAFGESYNFASKTTLEVSAYLILDAQYGRLAEWWNGAGLQVCLFVLADGSLRFSRVNDTVFGGTFLAQTAAAVWQFNVQHHIYLRVKFDNAAGELELAIDGITVLNVAGLDTVQQAVADCTQLRLFSASSSNVASGYWSHIALADSAGSVAGLQPRVSSMFPTADGADETGAQTGGTAGEAWSVVEETSPNDADYLDLEAGERNSFLYGNPPANLARVLGVQSTVRVWKTDADVVTARPYLTIGGVRYYGTTVGVPADTAYLTYLWVLSPATGIEFTVAELTAPIEHGWERVT